MDELQKIVRSASMAAWCTVIFGGLWLTLSWLIWLALLNVQPAWLLTLWGGGELNWPFVHTVFIWFMVAAKLILFAFVLMAVCLSCWACKLRKCCCPTSGSD